MKRVSSREIGEASGSHSADSLVRWKLVRVEPYRGQLAKRSAHGAFSDHRGNVFVVGGTDSASFDVSRLSISPSLEEEENFASGSGLVASLAKEKLTAEPDELATPYLSPRWAFASCYCDREKAFFMNGGFDQNYNHSTTRFYFSDENVLRTLCSQDSDAPSPRGFHAATYVPQGTCKAPTSCVYTFGGQCCVGGPYTFYNDTHKLDLSAMEWKRLKCSGDAPSPRSQSLSFLWKGHIYIYGGYNGKCIFADLHRLDLRTLHWTKLETDGTGPDGMVGLLSPDYSIFFCRPAGLVIGNKLLLLAEQYDTTTSALFCLHLKSFRWRRLQGTTGWSKLSLSLPQCARFNPPARGCPTLSLSRDGQLYLIGGKERVDQNRWSKTYQILGCRGGSFSSCPIWQISVPSKLDWPRERLLWLACFKNDRGECHLAKCPPHIIYHIIGYANCDTFYIREPATQTT